MGCFLFSCCRWRVTPKRRGQSRAGAGDSTRLLRRKGKKSHPRNPKRFHSRYIFGYGILLYMRKIADFCPFTAYFGDFEGVFLYEYIFIHM